MVMLFVCFFLWFKNKSKFRWCLVVSIVFNKRFFIIILCIVIVIYLYILDFFKKYRKFKWFDDLFIYLRSIFEYLKINKIICI